MAYVDSDTFDDNPLDTTESLDSDEVRNADGDEVADPPDAWIDAEEHESLDERLADEVPDITPEDVDPADADDDEPETELESADEIDHLDPDAHGRERGQIDGTPEDGESFFDIEK
jgi:hypothetical protein